MDDGRQTLELAPAALRRQTDPASLDFDTTSDLPAPEGMVGQERAQEAIDFALEMQDSRYNLFVNGDPGTGRRIAVATAVEAIAKSPPARSGLVLCLPLRPARGATRRGPTSRAWAAPSPMMSQRSFRQVGASCDRRFPAIPMPPNAKTS